MLICYNTDFQSSVWLLWLSFLIGTSVPLAFYTSFFSYLYNFVFFFSPVYTQGQFVWRKHSHICGLPLEYVQINHALHSYRKPSLYFPEANNYVHSWLDVKTLFFHTAFKVEPHMALLFSPSPRLQHAGYLFTQTVTFVLTHGLHSSFFFALYGE